MIVLRLERKISVIFSRRVTVAWRNQTMTSNISVRTASFKHRYKAKSRKYQGVFEVKSRVKTWQVPGIWSQQLVHKQVPRWGTEPGVRKGKRSLLACHTRCKYSMLQNKEMVAQYSVQGLYDSVVYLKKYASNFRIFLSTHVHNFHKCQKEYVPVLYKLTVKTITFLSKRLYFLFYFQKLQSGAHLYILSKSNYVPVGFVTPKTPIALFAVTEGWLLLNFWEVVLFFFNTSYPQSKEWPTS